MSGFWDRALNGQRAAPPAARAPVPAVQAALPQQYAQQQPAYASHGYALDTVTAAGASEAAMVEHARAEGFIKVPPKWIKQQASERCHSVR